MKHTTMVILWAFSAAVQADPVGSQFSYQGELLVNNAPADGAYDLKFELFSDASAGVLLDVNDLEDLDIVRGRINATLDFGDLPFTGDAVWLQIGVRVGNDTGGFQTLLPRQRVNAAPYAIQSTYVENEKWVGTPDISYSAGKVLVNAGGTPSGARFQVINDASSDAMEVRQGGQSRIRVHQNGGVSIGGTPLGSPPAGDVTLVNNGRVLGSMQVDNALTAKQNAVVEQDLGVQGNAEVQGELAVDAGLTVGIGAPSNTDLLEVEAVGSESPLRVRIDGTTRLRVHNNGGVSIGANVAPPSNGGVFVQGDARQALAGRGFAKAAARVSCQQSGSSVIAAFNLVNGQSIAVADFGLPGVCDLTVPFDASGMMLSVTSILTFDGGPQFSQFQCNPPNASGQFGCRNAAFEDGEFFLVLY